MPWSFVTGAAVSHAPMPTIKATSDTQRVSLLLGGDTKLTNPVVVRHDAASVAALPSWQYGRVLPRRAHRSCAVGLVAVLAAYAPSTLMSAGGCNVPPLLSLTDPPTWSGVRA